MTTFALLALLLCAVPATAWPGEVIAAQDNADEDRDRAGATAPSQVRVLDSSTPISDAGAAEAARLLPDQDTSSARPVAIQYSDAYLTRAKIHKYASFATLPLLATEFYLGQSLYNDPQSLTSGQRTAHAVIGASLVGLFAANSVTGVWNLVESRQAPGHTRRLVHGILMLAAEGGFVAAAASAPGHSRNDLVNFDANKATHRNIAVVSIGLGTAGYLMMLFGGGGH
jgi:hypothetical protein